MLKQTSKNFRKLFLLEFTRQLIRATDPSAFFELQEQIKEKQVEKKEEQKKHKEKIYQLIKQEHKKPFLTRRREIPKPRLPKVLTIPQTRLPSRLQYLRPTATNTKINIGKLNVLLKDKAVMSIECSGPDEKIMVRVPSLKPTNIILTKQEIDEIVNTFSQTAKIPADEGFFRVVVADIIFSAVISEFAGSKFIIKKIISKRNPMQRFQPMLRR